MPASSARHQHTIVLVTILVSMLVGGVYLFQLQSTPPRPGSPKYEQYVNEFQRGVAALDADLPQIAEQNLTRALRVIPREPVAWADRGLLYLRIGKLTEAAEDLNQAARLAPDDAEVLKLIGLLKQRQGQFAEAASYLRRALERDGSDIKALYLLAQVVDQEQLPDSDLQHQQLLKSILAIRPSNLRVLDDLLRVAVRRSDEAVVSETLKRFEELSPAWLPRTRQALAELKQILAKSLGPPAVPNLLKFSNPLKGETHYASDVADVYPKDELAGTSLQTFRWLPPIQHTPAEPDLALAFQPEPLAGIPEGRWDVALPMWLSVDVPPIIVMANSQEVRPIGKGAPLPSMAITQQGIVAVDWNNDLLTDLVVAGARGIKFYQQQKVGSFVDTTAKCGLSKDDLQTAYHSVLAADADLDGDLDLLVSRTSGAPGFLRNNFDGTFTAIPVFAELSGPQTITCADYDHDGAADVALLGADGRLAVYANERSGQFKAWPNALSDKLLMITSTDANNDGVFDIVAVRTDGALVAYSDRHKRSMWEVIELAKASAPATDAAGAVDMRSVTVLMAADFDNNGALDLLASGPKLSQIWLGAGRGQFELLNFNLPPRLMAAVDLTGKGRLDLVGIGAEGEPLRLRNTGGIHYHWQTIRPQAARGTVDGDNRINSFGIGGEIEVRAGTHVVKQLIQSPAVHFGLGIRPLADIIRVQWPNGSFQFEFSPNVDESIVAQQRLKGSCPFLFAWNGKEFTFVTDFMWSTPLGMYINASDKGGFLQTTDWVKIPGEQLAERDGQYELRVNANLWETHFFDHLALMAVDHPTDTDMYVDERFFMEPSPPAFILTDTPRSVARVTDNTGRDVSKAVENTDGVHLDIQRGRYQGVSQEHWVEIDLGDMPIKSGPLWLLARGWMHPTDSSVNYALEQGEHIKPHGLVMEVPDGQGGWKIARDRLGFPSGKNKTILLRLDGIAGLSEVPRRFRLRTNLEIYWDSLRVAAGRDHSQARQQTLTADLADLRFRGILDMTQASPSSPELPHYDRLVARGQYWRDLIGYHTRYGDINELLTRIDDRYAILCAGDEVIMKFAVPPAPPKGFKRDFVWVADGWVKDGDYNTRFGKTVLPLPAHDMSSYDVAPRNLEDDPVYQRHAADWQTYHTRYVTPHLFEQGLRNFQPPAQRPDGVRP